MKLYGRGWGKATWGTMAVSAVLLAAVAWGGGVSAQTSHQDSHDELNVKIGVVDFESLLKQHRDYENLQQLDEQIRLLKEELQFLPLEDQRRVVDSSQNRMRAEVDKAQKEVKAEYDRINRELAGLSASMAKQLDVEGRQLQEHYQKVLEQRLRELAPEPVEPPDNAKNELEKYMRDMAQVREQRLVAKRLELDRQLAARLEVERSRTDTALAAYDNEVMNANQEKRVNLTLRLQTASTPEEEAAIQAELGQLGEEEGRQKDAKAQELRREFESIVAAEQAKVNREMDEYARRLDEEAKAQFYSKRDKILGSIQPVNVEENRAIAKEQIEKVRNIVNAEMQAKQKEMQAAMKQRAEEAQAKLRKKQTEVEKRLLKIQNQLNALVQKSYENVSDETRKKMDDVKTKIAELEKQRSELHDSMVASLSDVVGGVAEKQQVDIVVGKYIVNVDCTDLTDLSMVALKQAQ